MTRRLAAALVASVGILGSCAAGAPAAGLRPLTLAFSDSLYSAGDSTARGAWLAHSAEEGAQVVRIDAGWPAATRPAAPADPADPAYDFANLDAAVRDAIAHRLRPLLSFTGAPRWAEGPLRPASAPPGSWRPDPSAVGSYGEALARRYDGRFPDPLHPGSALPKVSLFQLWNEPNLSQYLSPQWVHRAGRWIPAASDQYRLMLNAFYAGVKAPQPRATVVSAGAAPYGDFGHGQRTMPVVFWSNVLTGRVSFDVLAHQAYALGAPSSPALNADDVAVPDIGKLTKLVRAAERRGTALPRGERHRVWITETGYNTNPPNATGVPVATDARWLAQSLYLFWAQGVDLVTWYLIRDQTAGSAPGASSTGVYYLDGRPKPAALAYRFPVVGHKLRGGAAHAWIRAPAKGRLVLQVRHGGRWSTLRTIAVRPAEVLDLPVPRGAQALRASVAGLTSTVWTL